MPHAPLPLKTLFVDEPFSHAGSLRAARSRLLWNIISQYTDADLLLLKNDSYRETPVPPHSGYDHLYSLSLTTSGDFFPSALHRLASGQSSRFCQILDSKRYQMVVFGGLACLPLAALAAKTLPRCAVVIDVDKVIVPELKAKWKSQPDLQHLPQYWELCKQQAWDWYLLRCKPLFILHSPPFREVLKQKDASRCVYIPFLSELSVNPELQPPASPYLLFWGQAGQESNLAAAKAIVSEIYPLISKSMVEKQISLILCGGEELQGLCGGRIQYATAEMAGTLLSATELVLLPLGQADEENRIFPCAQAAKALICSTQAIAGYELPDNSCLSAPTPRGIADHILHLLKHPLQRDSLAKNLHDHYQTTWAGEQLTCLLLDTMMKWMEPGMVEKRQDAASTCLAAGNNDEMDGTL